MCARFSKRDVSHPTSGPWTWATDGPACVAIGGEGAGSECRFPFTYEGVVYKGCAYKPGYVIPPFEKKLIPDHLFEGVQQHLCLLVVLDGVPLKETSTASTSMALLETHGYAPILFAITF